MEPEEWPLYRADCSRWEMSSWRRGRSAIKARDSCESREALSM
jgi:hypothetical protein